MTQKAMALTARDTCARLRFAGGGSGRDMVGGRV